MSDRTKLTKLDATGYAGAMEAARQIREYWAARGYYVDSRVEHMQMGDGPRDSSGKAIYGVRTDMVNGMPVRRLQP